MKVLIVSATGFEIAPLLPQNTAADLPAGSLLHTAVDQLEASILITGVGLPIAAFHLGKHLAQHNYDLAIQAGVAGSFDRGLALGDVVQVTADTFADLGVEEADGAYIPMHELGLVPKNEFPFQDGWLVNPAPPGDFLPAVRGISVNKVHGYPPSIERIQKQYPDAQVESMEGAAFMYACLLARQNHLQIRAISNYVEARNLAAWELGLAIEYLNSSLQEMLLLMGGSTKL